MAQDVRKLSDMQKLCDARIDALVDEIMAVLAGKENPKDFRQADALIDTLSRYRALQQILREKALEAP